MSDAQHSALSIPTMFRRISSGLRSARLPLLEKQWFNIYPQTAPRIRDNDPLVWLLSTHLEHLAHSGSTSSFVKDTENVPLPQLVQQIGSNCFKSGFQ